MQIYPTAKMVNGPLLEQQITTAGLPGLLRVQGNLDPSVIAEVVFIASLTPSQKFALDTVIANHDWTQLTSDQQAQQQADAQHTAAISLDTPINALQQARTAITTAVSDVHGIDNTIQAFVGAATTTQLTSAMKSLSAAVREFVDAQSSGDQALANALQALKARFS